MVDHPRLTREPEGALVVWDVTTVRPRRDWRFLGWLLLGATIASVLYDIRGWRFVTSLTEYLVPLIGALLAVVLIGVGGKYQVVERPLLKVMALHSGAEDGASPDDARIEAFAAHGVQTALASELTHVVYGLVDVPWPGRAGVNVEAYAVYLAKHDGTPIPVIDGTMDKLASWQIARELSSALSVPLIELGKGQ